MTSFHSIERAKERLGFNRKYAAGLLERALVRGQIAADFKQKTEKAWMERQAGNGYKAVAYNGCCLIVSPDNVCVTVYPLPKWFGKKKRYDEKNEEIRHFSRYQRMSCPAWG